MPNHVSVEHAWFQAAIDSAPGSPERARFWFREGRGPGGDEMPTAWPSPFSGTTWTRTTNPDGTPGEWYLHLFASDQPDLNWDHPDVRREHEEILRFWFDRGVAGIRIDSAALLVKDPTLPEIPGEHGPGEHPNTDRDELHAIYRSWRSIADGYPGTRVLVGELWIEDVERFAKYLRPDELHTAFNFDFLARPWDAASLRESIDVTLAAHAPVGAPATWLISNHDVTRPVTRFGQADTSFAFARKRRGTPADLDLGRRRARAASLLCAALPGSLYIYQGEELGLEEVQDLPVEQLQDPMYFRSEGVDPGRDGCRVPLPWSGDRAPFGFSPDGARHEPWLRQPEGWAALTVEAQLADPESMLNLYRSALRIRRLDAQLGDGSLDVAPVRGRGARVRTRPRVRVRHQPLAGRHRAAGRGRGAPRQRTTRPRATAGRCDGLDPPGRRPARPRPARRQGKRHEEELMTTACRVRRQPGDTPRGRQRSTQGPSRRSHKA